MEAYKTYLDKHHFKPEIESLPAQNLSTVIVIPCYNEPDIISSLDSFRKCDRPSQPVEIILVLNYPEGCDQSIIDVHFKTLSDVKLWQAKNTDDFFQVHIINAPGLPKKFAGVGLARKIGMDEAVSRFLLNKNENGIICGFDADSTVDTNYLTAVENHFSTNKKTPGASIYYEHPVNIEDQKLKTGIIQYETHLRYLVQATRFTGFPYAYHTVGSSFAVRASAYVKQGGMNKCKAGEDFYFINKIIPLGNYTEINNTRVNPQARISPRVPFGTGASLIKWMNGEDAEFQTYQLNSFLPLKRLFGSISQIYENKRIDKSITNDEALKAFLKEINSDAALEEILQNSSSLTTFTKRFYNWFDAFRIVKYLNFAALEHYPKNSIFEEAGKLLGKYFQEIKPMNAFEMLEAYRNWDRSGIYIQD